MYIIEVVVQGLGFKVQHGGFRVQGAGFRVQIQRSGLRVQVARCTVHSLGIKVWGLRFRGFGFRDQFVVFQS